MIEQSRWSKFSLAQQIGNIGSEISRARYWEEKKDPASRAKSLERALELINLTLADTRHRHRLKEIARFQEIVGAAFADQNDYQISLTDLDNYCLDFALLARRT